MWRNIRLVEEDCYRAWFRSTQAKRIGFHTSLQAQATQTEILAKYEYELGLHV